MKAGKGARKPDVEYECKGKNMFFFFSYSQFFQTHMLAFKVFCLYVPLLVYQQKPQKVEVPA